MLTECFVFLQIFFEDKAEEKLHKVDPSSTLESVLKHPK